METRAPADRAAATLAPLAIFLSALLVFLVQPLVTRLLLPSLGGGAAVWNTSMVFFQAALLVGYAYAHALQRIASVRRQAIAHSLVLLAAATVLPLHVTGAFGEVPGERPQAWLLGVLLVSLGAPFAALSATAPLLQAWWSARFPRGRSPYQLYAASNLGSLVALLGYPLVMEPLLTLDAQRMTWSAGYGVFTLTAVAVGLSMGRVRTVREASVRGPPMATRWRQRAWWAALGAIPSSLLLGVTQHIATDVASAPLLWVIPLALYLLTFVIAFQDRPPVSPRLVLTMQAIAVAACLALLPFTIEWRLMLPVHLANFFLTALVCHQRLAADRPHPARLTEFYLALSVGGVLGGAFNALLAPQIFDLVWEYPLVLVLASAARPIGPLRPTVRELSTLALGFAASAFVLLSALYPSSPWVWTALTVAVASAFLLRDRAVVFAVLLVAISVAAHKANRLDEFIREERSFFGVHRVSYNHVDGIGPVKYLLHGTTLHGAQATDDAVRCRPITYYAPDSPMMQAVRSVQRRGPMRAGLVGLGAGSLTAVTRPGDTMRVFELDPLMVDIARTSFSYLGECAKGAVDIVVGDGRLMAARERKGSLDILFLDAFSSDSAPSHLMTTEAMRLWLSVLKPDGLLVVHVSNQNLELRSPVAAALRDAGAIPVELWSSVPEGQEFWITPSRVVAGSRDPATVARLVEEGPWAPADPNGVPAWTDDRTDVLGALLRRLRED